MKLFLAFDLLLVRLARGVWLGALGLHALQPAAGQSAVPYDPLRVPEAEPKRLELSFRDEARSRDLPVLAFLPDGEAPAPVVLFSPGLGGARSSYAYLGEHWAARGFVAVFLQHPGSDDALWRGVEVRQRLQAMREAASGENFRLRAGDVSAVIDELEVWNKTEDHPLRARLDLAHIGMSGHSFGSVTAQALSGQVFPLGMDFTDQRIDAALLMSPSAPAVGFDAKRSFGRVELPWLLMTGTEDISLLSRSNELSLRLAVFAALPKGDKYELVLDGANHMAFTGRALSEDVGPRDPRHHRSILAVSTAFWDAYLKSDAQARQWLEGPLVRGALVPEDRWQRK